MQALLTISAQKAASGSYHFATDDRIRSLCGTVDAESPFAADVYRGLTSKKAERRGFEVCRRCRSIADP